MPLPSPRPLAFAVVLLAVVGCRGDERAQPADGAADVGGTVVVATSADADILLPPLVTTVEGKKITDLLFDHLAEIGDELNTVGDAGFTPRLAERWTWAADSLSIAFHLDPRARWHDGAPVRAEDVRLTHQLYTNTAVGSPFGSLLVNIDSVSVADSLTAVFWFKRRYPEQFFDAVYQMSIVPAHLLGNVPAAELKTHPLARHPVGTGRFRFARWEPGQLLELVADTANYRGRARLDRVVWSIAPDFTAAATKLFAGEADFFETLRPEHMAELARKPELRAAPYAALDYGFMQFNLRDGASRRAHPLFGDVRLRRALTMALDRQKMVQSVFDSLAYVSLGPVTRAQASSDTTIPQLPFDLAAAGALLDSAGWRDANGDGVREKDGHPLEFTLLVPNSSRNRQRLAVLIQEQLKQAGARVVLEQLEFNTFIERQTKRDFDAVMGAWHVDPSPGNVRQTWGSAGTAKDGSNFGSYINPAFDAAVDSAVATTDPARSKAQFRQAYAMIVADAPAVWLYEVRNIAGAHKRLHLTGMRADAWWAAMADWSIPASERIERDRLGLRSTPAMAARPAVDSTP